MNQKGQRPSTAKKANLPPPQENIEDYMYFKKVSIF